MPQIHKNRNYASTLLKLILFSSIFDSCNINNLQSIYTDIRVSRSVEMISSKCCEMMLIFQVIHVRNTTTYLINMRSVQFQLDAWIVQLSILNEMRDKLFRVIWKFSFIIWVVLMFCFCVFCASSHSCFVHMFYSGMLTSGKSVKIWNRPERNSRDSIYKFQLISRLLQANAIYNVFIWKTKPCKISWWQHVVVHFNSNIYSLSPCWR